MIPICLMYLILYKIKEKTKRNSQRTNRNHFMEYPLQCTFAKLKNIINILSIEFRLFNKAF